MLIYRLEPGAFERKEVEVVNYAFGNYTTLPTIGRNI